MKVIVSGGHGLIGKPLAAALHRAGHEPVLLRRGRTKGKAAFGREVSWDPAKPDPKWMAEFDGASAVVNLAGAPVADKRWSTRRKAELRESRVVTTRAMVSAIASALRKPKVFLSASGIGFYGARDANPVDEGTGLGRGFLATLCGEWESEAARAVSSNVRTVFLRTGIVLSPEGGALEKMLMPFRFFLGGPIGSGRQVMSWIHIEDEVRAILFALENPSIHGPVNLAAPNPVSMKEFARTLGKVLGRPDIFPVPGFVLKLLLGEMSGMLLTGQNARPAKLLENGFRFEFDDLEAALRNLLR